DALSSDKTRQLAETFRERFGSFKILDNPARIRAAAFNIGFKNSEAPIMMIIDANTSIPGKDIFKSIVELFKSTDADCLCRPQPLAPPDSSEFQMSAAYCRSSGLGHRPGMEIQDDYEGYIDPTASGCIYKREVFDKIGFFDESFAECEDIDFNHRLKSAGINAYLSQKLRQDYYPPENPKGFWHQMYRYGKGRFRFAKKHNEYSIMQWIAGFGVSMFLLLLVLSLLSVNAFARFQTLLIVYLLVILRFSVHLAIKRSYLGCLLWGLVIFPIIHFGLGFGFLRELLSYASKK
ncbi:MAG: glycosyltransferase family 2 protein, partial [Candidatus Zixiibacteriota bacterium]